MATIVKADIHDDAIRAWEILNLPPSRSGVELNEEQELSLLRCWYEGTKHLVGQTPKDL